MIKMIKYDTISPRRQRQMISQVECLNHIVTTHELNQSSVLSKSCMNLLHWTLKFRQKEKKKRFLTQAPELFFKLRHMFTVGNTKIVISVRALVHTIRRCCSSDGHDSCRSLCPLSSPNFLHGNHCFRYRRKFFFFLFFNIWRGCGVRRVLGSDTNNCWQLL